MSQNAAPNAAVLESNRAVVHTIAGAALVTSHGQDKCIPLSALLVAKRQKFRLNPERGDLFTAASAMLKFAINLANAT